MLVLLVSEHGTRHWDYIPAEDHVKLRLCCGSHSTLVLRSPVCGVSSEREDWMCWMSGFGELGVFCLC